MGLFGKKSSDSGSISTNGEGGFDVVGAGGVTSSTGMDPVDNLIALASNLADQDEEADK